jgi:hypothetical protein
MGTRANLGFGLRSRRKDKESATIVTPCPEAKANVTAHLATKTVLTGEFPKGRNQARTPRNALRLKLSENDKSVSKLMDGRGALVA